MESGKIYYQGRRIRQFFVGGKRYIVKPHDILELPLLDCMEMISKYRFKPFQDTEEKINDYNYPKIHLEEIENLLIDKKCFIVGRGKSIKDIDLSLLKDEYTIGINKAFLSFDAKAVIFIDKKMVHEHTDELKNFDGHIFCSQGSGYAKIDFRNNVFEFPIHSDSPQQKLACGLFCGALSGLAAINLAMVLNAKRIYLLGYDLYPDGKNTYFDTDTGNDNYARPKWCDLRIKLFKKYMSFGDRIINCNPKSNIKHFPTMTFDEALRDKI